MHTRRSSRFLVGWSLVLVSIWLVGSMGDTRADDCKADLNHELRKTGEGSEHAIWVWKVDISTPEVCADVDFELKLEERLQDGEVVEQTRAFRIRSSSREIKSRKVNHVVEKGTEVTQWKFSVTGCKPC